MQQAVENNITRRYARNTVAEPTYDLRTPEGRRRITETPSPSRDDLVPMGAIFDRAGERYAIFRVK